MAKPNRPNPGESRTTKRKRQSPAKGTAKGGNAFSAHGMSQETKRRRAANRAAYESAGN